MVGLLDVNMLIALAWPSHVHHQPAQQWFAENEPNGWATCPLTQCAFVRISSNPKIISEAVTPTEAMALLQEVVALPSHDFWADAIPILDEHVPSNLLVGHRQVTDAYLLGLASHHGGRLITLDHGVESLLSERSPHRNVLHVVDTSQAMKGGGG